MIGKMVASAAMAVNLCASGSAYAHEQSELDACYIGLMRLHVEADGIQGFNKVDGKIVITFDPAEIERLSPDNRMFAWSCISMITAIDAGNPDTWPERPEFEPVLPEDWTEEDKI